MMKKTIFALLGLTAVLMMVGPTQAHAAVVVGVGVGPVYYGHPVYPYVYVHPRPVVPYVYAPGYVYRAPYWGPYGYPRPYVYRGYVGPHRYWR
jgi:hypothetical protein